MMGWYGAGGMGGGAWMLMGLFWLAALAVIFFVVLRLLPSHSDPDGSSRQAGPEEILARRFAHGEIDVEAYRAQRMALTSARGK